ncbi:hypothetical protein BGW80DRAFT_1374590, partial [Lactifluus volemus]
ILNGQAPDPICTVSVLLFALATTPLYLTPPVCCYASRYFIVVAVARIYHNTSSYVYTLHSILVHSRDITEQQIRVPRTP